MSRKMKNLERFWHEEGYQVTRNYVTEKRGDVFEVHVVFKRLDGQKIHYISEWDSIKQLANRQSFYAMPIHVGGYEDSEIKRVLLVKRESITKAMTYWKELVHLLEQSYWGLQADKEITTMVERGRSLAAFNLGLHVEVKAMYSNTPSKNLLNENVTQEKWLKAKAGTLEFCKELFKVQKAPEQALELALKLQELYAR